MNKFNELGLSTKLLEALLEAGYTEPTPIQEEAIPYLLKGRDLLGIAQTGTGKTAAFSLPILDILSSRPLKTPSRHVRTLVVTPTRELASQILESFKKYGKNYSFKMAVIFGGVSEQPQIEKMLKGVDILVATPGRLLDLIDQNVVLLSKLEIFILDEADRMLDLGFIEEVSQIISLLPKERQTLLFSATMPTAISTLANKLLKNPVKVQVAPQGTTADKIEEVLYYVEQTCKTRLLRSILKDRSMKKVIVFTKTKHAADKVASDLERSLIKTVSIHSDKSQGARELALKQFKQDIARVLVATDIAARGIDVTGITHVINYDLPTEPENYIHRIGRTARAGEAGIAITFCDEPTEAGFLSEVERVIKKRLSATKPPPLADPLPKLSKPPSDQNAKPSKSGKHWRGKSFEKKER